MNNIGIVGQGFVGNAIYQKFSEFYKVFTYDIDEYKCNSSLEKVVTKADVIFICLPTPMNKNGSCNVDIAETILDKINNIALSKKIIVIKSTIEPGSTKRFNEKFDNLNIVFNPEWLREAHAVDDFKKMDRVVLGGPRPATSILKQMYNKVFPNAKIVKTDSTYAEVIKYLINVFLATKVSLANEVYSVCQKLNVDYDKVIEYATMDKRLGDSHWSVPGPDGDLGYGGHCFPKDLAAFIYLSKELGCPSNVMEAAIKTNDLVRSDRDWEKMKGRAVV